MRVDLPSEYRAYFEQDEYLSQGFVDGPPHWIILWHPDEIESGRQNRSIVALVPAFLGFGSNGGGEMFAFDRNGLIFSFAVAGEGYRHPIKIAESWAELRIRIHK